MAGKPRGSPWKTLDRDLKRIVQMEYATAPVSLPLVGPGIAPVFFWAMMAALGGLVAAVMSAMIFLLLNARP